MQVWMRSLFLVGVMSAFGCSPDGTLLSDPAACNFSYENEMIIAYTITRPEQEPTESAAYFLARTRTNGQSALVVEDVTGEFRTAVLVDVMGDIRNLGTFNFDHTASYREDEILLAIEGEGVDGADIMIASGQVDITSAQDDLINGTLEITYYVADGLGATTLDIPFEGIQVKPC